jgi:hypothetical protein
MTSVMPPILATLRLDDVDGSGVQHCPDLEQARRVLAGRDPHAALAADTGKTRMMLRRPDWLLQPRQVAVL